MRCRVDVSDLMARFGRLPNAWENFEAALGAFSAIVEEQREGLKSNVASEVKEVQVSNRAFFSLVLEEQDSAPSRIGRVASTSSPRVGAR